MEDKRLYIYDDTSIDWSDTEEAYDHQQFEIEALRSTLDNIFKDKYLVAEGSLGLWNGRVAGGAVISNTHEFLQFMHDYNSVYVEDGMLKLEAIHHDGTNYINFRILSRRGVEFWYKYDDEYDRPELIKKLFKPPFSRKFTKQLLMSY